MYPYDQPSIDMSTYFVSGSYTPSNVVRKIRDNYTPVNKNSMMNSVGTEISAVQNFVNIKFLGRDNLPVESGFITALHSNSGYVYVYQSGYDSGGDTYNIINSGILDASSLYLSHGPQDPILSTAIYGVSGITINASNGISVAQSRELTIYPENVYFYGSGPGSPPDEAYGLYSWTTQIFPPSGIKIEHIHTTSNDVYNCNLNPSGLSWNYSDYAGDLKNSMRININSSGQILSIPNGCVTIGSGEPYEDCAFTVGNDGAGAGYGGDLFVRTHGGGGIKLTGDNSTLDRIISYAGANEPENGIFYLTCGSDSWLLKASGAIGLPADATDDTSSYALTNAIKALLISRGLATAIS